MKNFKKVIALFIAAISLLAINVTAANADWRQSARGWWYTQGASSYATGWNKIEGQWYHFDSNGYMQTGWISDNGNWYYLNSNGTMAHDCYIGGYYLNNDGVWVTETSSNTSYGNATSNNQSQTAYLSETGSKYHSISNCGRMNPNRASQTTVSKAEAAGYGRCSKCW